MKDNDKSIFADARDLLEDNFTWSFSNCFVTVGFGKAGINSREFVNLYSGCFFLFR